MDQEPGSIVLRSGSTASLPKNKTIHVQYRRLEKEDIKAGEKIEVIPSSMNYGDIFSAESLPPGLKIDAKTGKISGIPDLPGVYDSIVKVARNEDDHEVELRFVVSKAAPPPFLPLPRYSDEKFSVVAGQKLALRPLFTDASQASRYTFSASDEWPLPPGLSVSPGGVIQGAAEDIDPADKGVWESQIRVLTAGFGDERAIKLTFHVKPAPKADVSEESARHDLEIAAFIREFLAAHSGTAVDYAKFFSDPCLIGAGKERKSRQAVQAERQKIVAKYRERQYTEEEGERQISKMMDKKTSVHLVVNYSYTGTDKSGMLIMDMELFKKGDRWYILSYVEKPR
ncbi:MAG: Ig domain-containing protein [Candidatus Methylacidiphilales bacterium]|nr:Ig domain-containing protein [Candidatus Methylacidiphilales bacterium]